MTHRPHGARRAATRMLSGSLLALGIAMIVRTAAAGAGPGLRVGYLFGAALIAVGIMRIWLDRHTGGRR